MGAGGVIHVAVGGMGKVLLPLDVVIEKTLLGLLAEDQSELFPPGFRNVKEIITWCRYHLPCWKPS